MTDLTHDLQATGLIMYTAVSSNIHVPIQPSQHHVLLPPEHLGSHSGPEG